MKTGAATLTAAGVYALPWDANSCRQSYSSGTACTGVEAADAKLQTLPAGVTGAPNPVLTQSFNGSVNIPPKFFGMSAVQDARYSIPTLTHGTFKVLDSGCNWAEIETSQGVYNASAVAKLDAIVNYCFAAGIDILFSCNRIPAWAGVGGSGIREPASAAYYNSFIAWLYARYGTKIGYYEGWNEPNISGSFGGSNANLLTHQTMLYNAVKAQNAALKVLSPAFDEVGGISANTLNLNAFLVAGGGAFFDIVAHHWYKFQNINSSYSVVFPNGRLLFDRAITTPLLACLSANGQGAKEVWCTEVGYSNFSKSAMAESFVFLAAGGVKRCIMYSWDQAGWPAMALDSHVAEWDSVVSLLSGKTLTAINSFSDGDFGFVVDGVGYLSTEI